MDLYQSANTNVAFPKFKVEYTKTLNAAIMKLGVTDAFSSEHADFSKLVKPGHALRPCITSVLQKTYMDVNEEGTEAAAVTAIMIGSRAVRLDDEPKVFTVDRPFVIALRNNNTGELLFLGEIVNPKAG
jgi:serpin B